jgi:dephospho-CoA kinase
VTRVVALTGNVAAGKSTVSSLFASWGATVIDADQLVRELQQPGEPVFEAIALRFGPTVVDLEGRLDRRALRRIMLADPDAKRDLEAIVHPAVIEARRGLTQLAADRGESLVVADIPLLYEADDPSEYDAVVLVDAAEVLRRERLIKRRGFDPDEADRLIAAQMPSAFKRRSADFVIDNDGDLAALEQRTRTVWQALTRS